MASIAKLAYVFGHKLHKEALEAMADVLLTGKWTSAELEYAGKYIPTDVKMCETITYNRTINPTVFAKVRDVTFVKRGRLFSYNEALTFCDKEQEPIHKLFDTALYGESTVFFLR